MKNWAMLGLCLCSSLVSASTIDEVVFTARQVKIVMTKLTETHKQNPLTGSWYYSESKEERDEKKEEDKG